jgi:hypothetical protein
VILLKKSDFTLVNNLIEKYTSIYIKKDFLKLDVDNQIEINEVQIGLGLANLMAYSHNDSHKEMALRYATIISTVVEEPIVLIKCDNILSNLTIFTFSDILKKRKGYNKDLIHNRGMSLFEESYKEEYFSKEFAGKKEKLNGFQLLVSEAIDNVKNISISAPTSVGKSFLMKKVVLDKLLTTRCRNIVYLVPTRALIKEVMNDIQTELANLKTDEKIFITCSSEVSEEMIENKGIFILTQERLNQLCSNANDLTFDIDLIIIDEAQQIAEGARGILLEYTIKRVKELWSDIKIFFMSPLIRNPEMFINEFELKDTFSIYERLPTVNQNIITLEKKFRSSIVNVKYKDKITGNFKLVDKNFHSIEEKIAYIINKFNNGENSIVYCNKQSSTRKISKNLISEEKFPKLDIPELNEFSDYLKKYICEEYDLADFIQRGVAYHYSKLPSIIKDGIQDLAKNGDLKIITCTSTLLEGVNIQANNIYVYNPKKHTKLLSNLEFWNLSGRAGRMGKDLCGNIICIDLKSDWYNINYSRRNIEDVKFKKNKMINGELDQFKTYLENIDSMNVDRNNKEWVESNKNLESILLLEIIEGIDIKSKYSNESQNITEIDSILTEKINKNVVPEDLLKRLVGIDIEAINKLWNTFINKYNIIEDFFLLNPFQEGADKRFETILNGINKIFLNYKYTEGMIKAIKITSLKWMREKSMKGIIFNDFNINQKTSDEINSRIEYRLSLLNDDIRFTISKYLYAYQEILKEVLKVNGGQQYIDKLCNYPLYLEFGASKKTTLELMYLGIFREGAISLSKYIDNEDSDGIVRELKKLDIQSLPLNNYIKKKIIQKVKMI